MMLANTNVKGAVAARAPAAAPRVFIRPATRTVVRRYKEGEQADTSQQGQKAPRNPITGERLQPLDNAGKEGYQATQQIPQSPETSARIAKQLEASPDGRPFGEIQAFDGLGPEVINSRLAMLGFAVAAFFELTQGLDIFQQIQTYPLTTITTFLVFTVASWIPFLQGQSYNVKSGPFTPAAEVTIGRIAMLGIVGLILNEAYFGKAFFPHLF